jgi:hypothetical protein
MTVVDRRPPERLTGQLDGLSFDEVLARDD